MLKLRLNYQGQTLGFDLTESEHRIGRDAQWADIPVPENDPLWASVSGHQATLRQEGDTYRIFDGDFDQQTQTWSGSTNGLFIDRKRVSLVDGYRLLRGGDRLTIGQNPLNCITLAFATSDTQLQKGKNARLRINLSQRPDLITLGREAGDCDIPLNSPLVSRVHATIARVGVDTYQLTDNNSTNGTLVSDPQTKQFQPLRSPHRLKNGDVIQIGSTVLTYRDAILEELFNDQDSLRIDARNILCCATTQPGLAQWFGAKLKPDKQLVKCPKIEIEPGITAFIGPSGAGKSTSMKSLLGLLPRQQGVVRINDRPVHGRYNLAQASIGYVPQADILEESLTIEQSLTYTARLRLPPDTKPEEIRDRIRTIALPSVDLKGRERDLIGQLSGGEKKRVSIAAALLTNSQGIFLDEPTSALDPGLEKEIFKVLRQLADQGKTIVVVTHSPFIAERSDQVALITWGGNLDIVATPEEVKAKYGVTEIEEIYTELHQQRKIVV
jgi:ABC-type multidrug transport system ATPase subunit/pSer/pThr/pTyr-binding forkhead associated (FHA) protein